MTGSLTDEERRIVCTALHLYGSHLHDVSGYALMKGSRKESGKEWSAQEGIALRDHAETVLALKSRFTEPADSGKEGADD